MLLSIGTNAPEHRYEGYQASVLLKGEIKVAQRGNRKAGSDYYLYSHCLLFLIDMDKMEYYFSAKAAASAAAMIFSESLKESS